MRSVIAKVEANGVTLGVEHFGAAAAPLVLLAGGPTSSCDPMRSVRRRVRGATSLAK